MVALADGEKFSNELCRYAQLYFNDSFLAFYKMGSLAHGGYSAEFSDIDLALFLSEKIDATQMEAFKAAAETTLSRFSECLERLSLFYGDSEFSFGRFPVLDRLDLIDHGVIIQGSPILVRRPSLPEVKAALLEHANGYWKKMTENFSNLETLQTPKDRKEIVRVFLYPARFLYTWHTGKLGSNDMAVEFINECKPAQLDLDPIRTAFKCRKGQIHPETLVGYRSKLLDQRQNTLLSVNENSN